MENGAGSIINARERGRSELMENDVVFLGNSFFNSTLNGAPLLTTDRPRHFGQGSVAWPESWSHYQRAEWRRQQFCQGLEWHL